MTKFLDLPIVHTYVLCIEVHGAMYASTKHVEISEQSIFRIAHELGLVYV